MKILILSFWLVSVLASGSIALSDAERAYVKKHPVLKVQSERSFPPYNFLEEGKPSGISIDYIRLIAEKIGMKVHFVGGHEWNEYVTMLRQGRLDALLNIISTPQRERYMRFTEPYAATHKAIFTQNPALDSLERLKGKLVCVPKNYYIEHFLRSYYPDIVLQRRESPLACLRSVERHLSVATVGGLETLGYLIKRKGLKISHTFVLPDKRLSSGLRIAVRSKEPQLRDLLQKAMYKVTDRELDRIYRRWTGKGIVPEKEMRPSHPHYKKQTVIRMCNNPNWAPIEFAKDGDTRHMQGIVIDTLKLIEAKTGVRFKTVPTKSWSESQQYLREGKCDLLPAAVETEARKKYASFTQPYLSYRLAVITQDDKPFIQGLREIADKTVARKKGSGLIDLLKKLYPHIRIIETKDYLESLKLVERSKAYCTIATLPVASYYITRYALNNLHVAGYLDMHYRLAMAVRKDKPDLLAQMKDALAQIDEREQNAIYAKWIQGKLVESYNYRPILYLLAVAALIGLLLYYRQRFLASVNRRLQKEIAEKVEENLAQHQLIQEQAKLAALGEMIGVIAHQWRQPLSALSVKIQNLKYDYADGKVDQSYIEEFVDKNKQTIRFMSRTIENFRNFFRIDREERSFGVREAVESVVAMQSHYLKEQGIEVLLKGGDFLLTGRRNEFQQVILSLLGNARDALKSSEREDRKVEIEIRDRCICVRDNGGGIPETIRDRIFDNYFTTKKEEGGTGIGLYMARSIVERHLHGRISVRSEEGWSEFILEFPEAERGA